jgi:hypothetical protein
VVQKGFVCESKEDTVNDCNFDSELSVYAIEDSEMSSNSESYKYEVVPAIQKPIFTTSGYGAKWCVFFVHILSSEISHSLLGNNSDNTFS